MIKCCEIDISMTYRCVINGFAITLMHKVDTHETREMPLIERINLRLISVVHSYLKIKKQRKTSEMVIFTK